MSVEAGEGHFALIAKGAGGLLFIDGGLVIWKMTKGCVVELPSS
jgi:hypothetical protein